MQQPLLILSAGEDLNDDALQIELERRGACVRRFILNKAGYGFRYNFVDDTWQIWDLALNFPITRFREYG